MVLGGLRLGAIAAARPLLGEARSGRRPHAQRKVPELWSHITCENKNSHTCVTTTATLHLWRATRLRILSVQTIHTNTAYA